MEKVTIHDVAEKLNITFSTVARALNDHPSISEKTKKNVREIADKLGYTQNKLASSLRSGRTNIIGIMVPTLDRTFFSSVIVGIEKIMNQNGYNILLYQSNENLEHEKAGIETFLQSRVDGIVASISQETFDPTHFESILKRDIPLIFFDRHIKELKTPSVTIDDYKGGFIATEHLIKQGYKDIVHITAEEPLNIFKERLRGYKDALIAYSIPINEELIIKGKFSLEFGQSVIRRLVHQHIKFDAVFALEDFTAMGVIQELKNRRFLIPSEVGVIGFANEAFGKLVSPQLSSIDQQSHLMGEEVARLFLRVLKEKEIFKKTNKIKNINEEIADIVFDPILLIRESSNRNGV